MAAMKWCQVACIAVLFAAAYVTCSPMRMMEEGTDNEISIRFDSVTLEQWEMAQADTNIIANDEFPKIIAESATSYCQGSMGSESLCKIGTSGTASNAFTESDVMIQTGYPKNENLDVQVVFYLSIVDQPKPEDENQYALQRSVLEAILKESQSNISSAVGYEVVFIGDERVGSPLDGTMNMVMIPLTIAVLVFLILITCCLNCRENRNDKAAGFASGKKRAEIPVEDAHGEGVVLTALNKGSSGGPRGCRDPRKKKRCSSGEAEKTDHTDKDSSISVTKHISVNPVLEPTQNTNNSRAVPTKLPPLVPIAKPTLSRGKSRHIEMPPSYDAVAASTMQDTEFLEDSDAGSSYLDDDDDGLRSRGQARAEDKESLIKQSGRLSPLDQTAHSTSSLHK